MTDQATTPPRGPDLPASGAATPAEAEDEASTTGPAPAQVAIDSLTGDGTTWSVARSVFVVFAIGLSVSLLITVLVHEGKQRNDRHLLDQAVRQTTTAVGPALSRYSDPLYGLRGLFAGEQVPSSEQYAAFVRSSQLLERHPGVVTLAWAPELRPDEVDEFERAMQRAGNPDYEISPPPEPDTGAAPITYVAPLEGNASAVGFDLAADDSGRAALRSARESGEVVVGTPLLVVGEGGRESRAVNLYLALYEGGPVPPGPARATRHSGNVVATLVVADAMEAIRGSDPVLDLEVYDVGEAGNPAEVPRQEELLYDSDGESFEAIDPSGLSESAQIEVGGRTWMVYMTPGPGFDPYQPLVRWWMVVPIGLLISGLIAMVVADVVRSRREVAAEAVDLADEMTDYLRQRERQLEQANENMRRSNKELERYASIAAHDLQEPLRSLLAYASVIERRYGESLDPDAMDHVRRMARAAERMRTLVVDLLTYAKADSALRRIEAVDLNEAVRVAIDDLSSLVQECSATVRLGELPTVPGNRRELIGVFSNLISNALKYRSDEPPEVVITASRDDAFWVVAVKDNGIGISSEYHDRIFELFRRLEKRESDTGTGLGLAICARTIQQHGGRIWVESEEGAGSVFRFSLPAELSRTSRDVEEVTER